MRSCLILIISWLAAAAMAQPAGISGLATPIQLQPGVTEVWLEDYFDNPAAIEMVDATDNMKAVLSADKKKLSIETGNFFPWMTTLRIRYKGADYTIAVKRSSKVLTRFTFDPQGKTFNTVQLVGDVNAWNPANTPMPLQSGKYVAELWLNPGVYGYQLVLDGKWQLDPANAEKMDNGAGGFNSRRVVPGPNPAKLPYISTRSAKGNTVTCGLAGQASSIIALWENRPANVKVTADSFVVDLPAEARTMERSHLRLWAVNAEGVSNDVLIPLHKGVAVQTPALLNRQDKHTNILYFLMVDRFLNGNRANDHPNKEKDIAPRANHYGGDLAGVTRKIREGFFDRLGMNTIWLSPVSQNPYGAYGLFDKGGVKSRFSAYHGYWPLYLTQVEKRFGTDQELKALVDAAHKRGINVLLDLVAHHVHQENKTYQQNKDKDWFTNLYLPDGTMNVEKWDEQRLTTWFDTFLPTWNFEKQEVANLVADSSVYWLDRYHVDGFRHDATKHIPLNFWRAMTARVKQYAAKNKTTVYQVGETYGTSELISSYINTGMLDGQFDFNVYDAILSALCKDNTGFGVVRERLQQSFDYYGTNNLMGYMSGNQDKARFMSLATGDVRFDEDAKLAGWTRDIRTTSETGYRRLAMMHAFNLSIPGVPCVYYGDEIGLPGGNDPDNRRPMRFSGLTDQQARLQKTVATLARLRRGHMALLYGDFRFLEAGNETMAYCRHYFGKTAVVVFNKSSKPRSLSLALPADVNSRRLKAAFGTPLSGRDGRLTMTLPAYGFDIFFN